MSLPRSSPTEQQVDARALLRVLDALEAHPDIEMHSLMVVRHGHVVAEGWWAPYSPQRPHLLYSVSKSFTMTAALLAQAEGVLGLGDTVLSHFPELDAEVTDLRSRATTFEDLAAMASGHDRDLGDLIDHHRDEPVRALLVTPPDGEPGKLFAYNQLCTYSLAAAVQRRSGQRLTEYLRPRLFDPLGIGPVGWQSFPEGREIGFSGLHARTEDIARLGQLYLQRGRWEDQQLLPEDLVAEATRKHVENAPQGSVDWEQGYGWQFWMSQHGYRGDGAFGQFCIVLPEHDVVVATTARTEAMQEVLDVFWTHLLPGLSASSVPPDEAAEAELASRLTGLALPPCPGSAGPSGSWSLPVAPAEKVPLESVELSTTDGMTLTLVEARDRVSFPVGPAQWAVSEPTDAAGSPVPVAASGGWAGEGTFRAAVVFLETPHRLDVTCVPEQGRAEATWRLAPLGNPALAHLRCPR